MYRQRPIVRDWTAREGVDAAVVGVVVGVIVDVIVGGGEGFLCVRGVGVVVVAAVVIEAIEVVRAGAAVGETSNDGGSGSGGHRERGRAGGWDWDRGWSRGWD